MVKDWIIIRMIFSGALIGFGILHIIYTMVSRFFSQAKFKKNLHEIKENDIQKIIEESIISDDTKPDTKTEINELMKSIYFDLYQKQKDNKRIQEGYSDMEKSINQVLDNDIIALLEEKERLLQEKDKIILMLEEKNEQFITDITHKISYLMQEKDRLLKEKDKLLKEKDMIILALYKKSSPHIHVPHVRTPPETKKTPVRPEPRYHYREQFINVNE